MLLNVMAYRQFFVEVHSLFVQRIFFLFAVNVNTRVY